jgi:chorismate mutase
VSQTTVRAARGAIRVAEDTTDAIHGATERLLGAMLERNEVRDPGDLVSVFFTVTEDLRSAFPAEAARRMGLGSVPLMCAQEIPVAGAMPGVVRVLMHFHTDRAQAEVVHVYLDGAESLRDDLG